MLWYSKNIPLSNSLVKNRKKSSLKKLKKIGFTKPAKTSIYHKYSSLHIPKNWNFIIIKKKINNEYNVCSAYIYSTQYYFRFNIDYTHSKIIYDPVTQSIITRSLFSNVYSKVFENY